MAYSEFTLERVRKELGIVLQPANLFPHIGTVNVPAWLDDTLARNMELPLVSEKARSETIVLPVLVAAREVSAKSFTIYSGHNLPGDPAQGLSGECDFILAKTPTLPILSAPVATIVEAKKSDIDLGLGQCVAQMIGVRLFNRREGHPSEVIHGCVTTGDDWLFLKLSGNTLEIDQKRYYLRELGTLLAIFQAITA